MSIVERLAKKYAEYRYPEEPETMSAERDAARFFINSIAEELEAEEKAVGGGDRQARHNADAAAWLRQEASE